MGPSIAATAYGTAAVLGAWFFRPRMIDGAALTRGLLFWLIATPLLFFLPDLLLALICCGVAAVLLAPRPSEEKLGFYLIAVMAVPSGLEALLPFPGINYLIVVDFTKVAAIALLVPAIAFRRTQYTSRYAPVAGAALIAITIIYSLQEFRDANLTSGLRASLNNVLLYAVPFAAIVRLATTTKAFDLVFGCIFALAVVFAFSAAVSQATSWNFYTFLAERAGIPQFADIRDGFLRVGVTTIPVIAGYIVALGVVCVEYFRTQGRIGFFMAWFYRALFLATCYFTVSRGAWLAAAAAIAVFWFFAKAPRAIRPVGVALGLFIGLPLAYMFVFAADFSSMDQYGTFEYRRDLLEAAWIQVQQKPLFGDPRFLESGNFDHLVQGQGIIDVVNYYVQITLEHGLVSLVIYLGAFAAVIAGLLRLGAPLRAAPKNDPLELKRAVLVSFAGSYLVMMATVSGVSVAPLLGVVLLALCASFIAAARKELGDEAAVAVEPSAAALKGDLYA